MELATGAMGSLLPKLDGLLGEEYKLQKGLRDGLRSLRKEMASMEASLVKLAELPSEQLDVQVRIWAGEVREVSYVMEDSIDRFMVSSLGDDSDPDSLKSLMKKMAGLFNGGKARREIAHAMASIKRQLQEVADRRDRYKMDDFFAVRAATTTCEDPDLLAISDDHRELIGVQEVVDEIRRVLMKDGGDNLKVLSICGFGGLGKTTIAKAVYERMRTDTEFDCAAIVSMGRNPDVKKVFKDIQLQIGEKQYTVFSAATLDQRLYAIRELLTDKRYFIIIDDIWDLQAWEVIRCALVKCKPGSIIITTTRINEVAHRAGVVYNAKPLSAAKSEELFYAILSARKGKLPDDHTTGLVQKILQRCGGVPLAITTIATLLSNKPKEDWYEVYDSINFRAADDRGAFLNIRKVIMFSYYDLPIHLRACLLHMTIFPEDYMVRKDALIWMWVAEGFIPEESGLGLFEIGERYFNELINRSLIQPVKITHSGGIIGCRVHDMILDMICSITQEENFITILNSNEQQHASMKFIARRLALHKEFVGDLCFQANTGMSRVRAFNAFMCHTAMMPSLESFEALRVLAIEDCRLQSEGRAYSLEHIGKLLHLRYLGLWKTPVCELPEVGKLTLLEVLDLRQTGIRELPKSVSLLRRLKCLRADGCSTRVPDWIGNLTSLEELSLNDVSSCPNFVKEVSKLSELRELKIWIRVLDGRSKKALVKSLGNLQKIQVLHLDGGLWLEDAEWEGYVPPRQLRRLSLRIKSSRLPRWIDNSLLPNLSHLSVDVRVVEKDDLETLGSLPELITLELFMPNGVSLDVKCSGAFPKLRHCYASGMLRFLRGAAPLLESVHFNVMLPDLNGASFQCGSLRSHPLLKEVRVEIFYSDIHGAAEVEEALRRAVNVDAKHPILLHVSKFKLSFDKDAEKEEDIVELEEDDEEDDWFSPTANAD